MSEDCQNKCIVLHYYELMGKKWSYPILYNLERDKEYSFEDLIRMTNRKINRTLLSDLLKEFIELEIIRKQEHSYFLTKKGIELKGIMEEVKEVLLKNFDKVPKKWQDDCLIKKLNK